MCWIIMKFVLKVLCRGPFFMLFSTVTVKMRWGIVLPRWRVPLSRRLSQVCSPGSSAGLAWPWLPSRAGSGCGSGDLRAFLYEWSQYEEAVFLLKTSAQTQKLPCCSKTALFVFWCRWWCQHSSGSSGDFLPSWHVGRAKVESIFFNKDFLAEQHFFFFFNEVSFCFSSVP